MGKNSKILGYDIEMGRRKLWSLEILSWRTNIKYVGDQKGAPKNLQEKEEEEQRTEEGRGLYKKMSFLGHLGGSVS